MTVPYPADHGGACEMFLKIRALHAQGVKIHLHCFDYGRGRQPILGKYCAEVTYYERLKGHKGFSLNIPYIVSSRANPLLLRNLLKDDYPILFEGIHTTYYLFNGALENRNCIIRLHNVEYRYYRHLAAMSRSWVRKLHYFMESMALRSYERSISARARLLSISDKESDIFRKEFQAKDVSTLGPFSGMDYPLCKEGIGNFCLYHGNLSVPENEKAALWLLREVFNDIRIPFVIAGKGPSGLLEKRAHKWQHTCLVADPSEKEMQDLVQKAQIHILPSFTGTGIKFKLMNAVFFGRHVIVNGEMVEGTGLENACYQAEGPKAFKSLITQLFRKSFDEEEIMIRERIMHLHFNDEQKAKDLISRIW
jgi:hypothetical protein